MVMYTNKNVAFNRWIKKARLWVAPPKNVYSPLWTKMATKINKQKISFCFIVFQKNVMIFFKFLAPCFTWSLYAQFDIIVIQISNRFITETVKKSSTELDNELLARQFFHNEKSMKAIEKPGEMSGRTSEKSIAKAYCVVLKLEIFFENGRIFVVSFKFSFF